MNQIEGTNYVAASFGRSTTQSVMTFLTTPMVDRLVGIVAVMPTFLQVYRRLHGDLLNLPNVLSLATALVLISTMFTRRPPVRVTPNPLYWLLAFVATYGLVLPAALARPGRTLIPALASNIIAAAGWAIAFYARLSLGRNIGFVPAQRRLVATGAYRFVRHPIYTGVFVNTFGAVSRNYTPRYAILAGTICLLFIIKSFVEEGFLKTNPQYAKYMQLVRYRWIPGLL
jgi:protein-S-isoprenylcysteine O-methyltransferase Ste14